MIKIISFDMDGTLVKNLYADKVWLEGIPTLYSKENKINLNTAKKYIFKEYDKIGNNRIEWYDIDWWFKKLKLKGDYQNILKEYSKYIEPYPETLNVIKELSNKYDLIIISNAQKNFINIQLEKIKLKPYFKHIFSSTSHFKSVKKSSSVFKIIISYLNIKSSEMIHIGDNFEFDYINPKKIGIKSYYIDRKLTKNKDDIINSLYSLEELIN